MMSGMVWLWLAVTALSVFVEAATWVLVSVWFAAGALCATFAAYAGASLTVQLLLFVVVAGERAPCTPPRARYFPPLLRAAVRDGCG